MSEPRSPRVVHVLLGEAGGASPHVELLTQRLSEEVPSTVLFLAPEDLAKNPFGWLRARRTIRRAVVDASASIVHAHGVRAAAAVAQPGALPTETKSLVTVQGLHSFRRATRATLRSAVMFNRLVLSRFDMVITVSRSDRRTILEYRMAPPFRVKVVNPAIEHRPTEALESGPPARTGLPRVLWAGRLVHQKNPQMLIRVMEHLRNLDARWVVAGDGPLMEEVKDLAAARALPVDFIGWRQDLWNVLQGCDVMISTARWEGLPVTLLEAGQAGLPIVATDVPGNRDLRENGVPVELVARDDDREMAHVLKALLVDPSQRRALGDRTKGATRSAFDVDVMITEMHHIYRALVQ